MGVACVALRIGGGEDGVHEDESVDNLRSESAAFGVAAADDVRPAAEHLVLWFLEALHNSCAADGAETLHHDVEDRPSQRQLPRQQ